MARQGAGRVLARPSQSPGLIAQYTITRAEADAAVWVVDTHTGEKFSAASATNYVLRQLGGGWTLMAALYRLPPLRWLEDRIYEWVAAHRSWLSRFYSTTPECEREGVECES